MIRLIVTSDWHFSLRAPEGRTSTYGTDVLVKLGEIAKIVEQTKAQAVLCAGDLFHRKGDVTHHEVQLLTQAIRAFGVPMIAVHGNHDATPGLYGYRAYGTMAEAGVFHDVSRDAEHPVWLSPRVLVGGHGYDVDVDRGERAHYVGERREGIVCVHLVHGYLVLGEPPAYMEEYTTTDVIPKTSDVVVCGHYHTWQGDKRVNDTLFVCPGATSRVTRSEKDNPCRVGVLCINEQTHEADIEKWVDLNVAPAEHAFIAADKQLASPADAKKVADGMYAGSSGTYAEIDEVVSDAVAKFEYGAEVEGDVKARIAAERARLEGGADEYQAAS